MIFHADRGSLLEKIEKNAEGNGIRLWAKVRHIGPLVYLDDKGNPYEEFVTEESITDPEFVNDMLFLPVTDDHPDEFIRLDNIMRYMKGMTGTQPAVDDDGFLIDFTVFDPALIQKIENGKRDVSLGYKSVVQLKSDNRWYQIKCKPNHLAIVDEGRAPKAAIVYPVRGDSILWQPRSVQRVGETMKKILLDGKEYEVEDAVAEALDGMSKKHLDLQQAFDALKQEHDKLLKRMCEADAEIARLRENKKDESDYIKAAEEEVLKRYAVIDAARRYRLKQEFSPHQSSVELAKQFILATQPKADLEGKDADYIFGRFDSLLEILKEKEEEENLLIAEEEEEDFEEEDFDEETEDDLTSRKRVTVDSLLRNPPKKIQRLSAYERMKKRLSEAYKVGLEK